MSERRTHRVDEYGNLVRLPYCAECKETEERAPLLTFKSRNPKLANVVRFCWTCWCDKEPAEAAAFLKIMKRVDE